MPRSLLYAQHGCYTQDPGQAELQSSRASRDIRKSLKTQNKAMLKGSKTPSASGRAKGVSKQLDPEEWETNLTY